MDSQVWIELSIVWFCVGLIVLASFLGGEQ
jgi:hypothetical protein